MRKLGVLLCLVTLVILTGGLAVPHTQAYASISSQATSMVVIESNNNTILYSKNEHARRPMASTTKIMTCITVIENCDNLDEIIKVSRPSTLVEGTSIYLKNGEEITVRQLLYGLMLQSGNDAAHALAMHVGGSIEGFAELMNKVADKIGVSDTHFMNPHGLDNIDHYTTAYDLAIITSYALKNPTFKEIVSSTSYIIEEGPNTTRRVLKNKNRLLNTLEGCIGVKTGYTSKAGRCLVSACERDGMQVVCVVLNCGPMFEESAALINEAFREYKVIDILQDNSVITELPVVGGDKSIVHIFNKYGYRIVSKDTPNLNIEYELPKALDAPVVQETKIGKIKVYDGKDLIFETDLYTLENIDSVETKSKIKDILDNWYKG